MIDIIRQPDSISYELEGEKGQGDCKLDLSFYPNMINISLTALSSRPRIITLRWNGVTDKKVSVMGDAWERAYGELGFHGIDPDRYMPWYFLVKQESTVYGYGVMTLPSAMVSWKYDDRGISLVLDTRCGGRGVCLNGRKLSVCTVVSAKYNGLSSYEAAHFFCKLMCPLPLLPKKPLYGGNNWYYAYGHSSYEEIIADASLQARLSQGLENRPFMVIDDGWQINSCAGPWQVNEKFVDMKKIADEFKKMDVRPGIWVRYLRDERREIPASWRLDKWGIHEDHPDFNRLTLDPSVPEVLDFVGKDTERLVLEWGYELIKHDFSTIDMFGKWGFERNKYITDGDWSFADTGKTSAEIVKNFYKKILDSTHGKALILGCNCIGHLAAGLVHANRTGDDTSGNDWSRTRKMGVNTLAFRLCQNNTFYAADADCVGIIPGRINPVLNMQWAELLAKSASPFFISCANGSLDDVELEKMKELYKIASRGIDKMEVLDYEYSRYPSFYLINGKEVCFDWYSGE